MDPNQVMNNLRKVGDVLEIDTVKPGLKCLQALVSTGKGMADECVRAAEDDDDADGAGSGSGSRGRGAEGAAIREEAAALVRQHMACGANLECVMSCVVTCAD